MNEGNTNKQKDHSSSHHLETLIEFNRTINSFTELDKTIDYFFFTLMGKFLIYRIALFLKIENSFKFIKAKGISISNKQILLDSVDDLDQLMDNYILSNLFDEKTLLKVNDQVIGAVLYSFHSKKPFLTNEEKSLFQSIVNVATTTFENKLFIQNLIELNKKLQIKFSHLKSLFELSKEFSLLLNAEDVYKFLSYTIMGNFLINKFALILIEDGNKKILGSNFKKEILQNLLEEYKFDSINQTCDLTKDNIPLSELIQLKQFQISLIVPLEMKNKKVGLMFCGEKLSNQKFTDDEIELIESLGNIAAISLENIKLFREMIEKQKIEEEIRIAMEIQQNLLPSFFPESQVFKFFGLNRPSRQVGGDYFDVFRINENQILILIADVVGKGIPAALVMANLQAMVKALTYTQIDLSTATKELNKLISRNLSTGNFITFFWGLLDEKNKTLQYVNAGHNFPILLTETEVKRLDKGGIILGVVEMIKDYESEIIPLSKNDLLVLFTDGFIEVTNEIDQEFGENRFIEDLKKYKNYELEIIAHKLVENTINFSNNFSSLDDLTILLARTIL